MGSMTVVETASPSREPRRGIRIGLGVLLLVVVVALATTLVGAAPSKLVTDPSGRKAPDFTLPLLDGEQLSLASLRGRPVVLNFWASWCGPCKDEAPALARSWRRWKDRGVTFMGVDSRDSRTYAREFMQHYDQGYQSFFDAGAMVTNRYGVRGFPETFFIDAAGGIQAKFVGPIGDEALDAEIAKILPGS
jgi:cytochrome c biogenesis protein CcmG/thiol:disulfide interchange protein DsbE